MRITNKPVLFVRGVIEMVIMQQERTSLEDGSSKDVFGGRI